MDVDGIKRKKRATSNAFRSAAFLGEDRDSVIAFVCECGSEDCKRTVPLTADEYASRRPGLILHESHRREPRHHLRLVS